MIIFVSDNVVSCTASIVHRHMLATCLSGHPNFLLSCVLVISWSFLDHLIKKTLKRSLRTKICPASGTISVHVLFCVDEFYDLVYDLPDDVDLKLLIVSPL